jgi:hypothetical protein
LFQPGRLGACRGERPWIGDRDPQACGAPKGLNLLTRSATNTYFPQVATVISMPQAEDELSRRIRPWVPKRVLATAAALSWPDGEAMAERAAEVVRLKGDRLVEPLSPPQHRL